MTVKRNDASGAANGTTVTVANSGTATADGFTTVSIAGGATLTYDTKDSVKAFKATGTYGTTVGSTTTPMTATVAWSLSQVTRLSGRIELWLPSPGPTDTKFQTTGSGNGVLWALMRITGSFNGLLSIIDRITNSGNGSDTRSYLRFQAGGMTLFFAPTTVIYDKWWRVEFDFVTNNPNGRYTVKTYADRYTSTPTNTWSTSLTWSSPGSVSEVRFGADSSLTDSYTTPVSNWFGGLYIADDGSLPAPATPPADAKLSTLVDPFTSINAAKWTTTSGTFAVNTLPGGASSGAVVQSANGVLTTPTIYQPDQAMTNVYVPEGGTASLHMKAPTGEGTNYVNILISRSGTRPFIRAAWSKGGVTGDSRNGGTLDLAYDPVQQPFIRIDRVPTFSSVVFVFATSPDGLNWETFETVDMGATLPRVNAILSGTTGVAFRSFNVAGSKDTLSSTKPSTSILNPGAISPAEGDPDNTEPICDTLINLIRKFSAEVKQPVRIVDANTIEMVNPYAPLPAGFTNTDGQDMYHSYSRKLTAGVDTLSVLRGDVQAELSGELVSDDMRTALSGLKLPNIYPVPELSNAPVKRLTLTFTPKHHTASIEFHLRDVPLDIRER